MLKRKIMMPWISISFRHNQRTLNKTLVAIEQTLKIYKKALKYGPKKFIDGHVIKPVLEDLTKMILDFDLSNKNILIFGSEGLIGKKYAKL